MSNSPLRLLDTGFGDSFDTALRRVLAPAGGEADHPALKMKIDVSESPEHYVVKADIPGVKKEDIHVRIDGNVVRIDAEARQEKEIRGEGSRMLRSERYYGNISRSFSLAQDVDSDRSQARYNDGVLTLELPKKQSSAAKKLSIQ